MAKQEDDRVPLSPAETERRREAALKRMLSTPHKPQKPMGKEKANPKPQKRTSGKGRARVGKARS